jgi:large subunit ribosomal protein L23
MIGIYDVVKRPLVTEASMASLDKANTYVFEVHSQANKVQIKNAIERLFTVKVLSVNTQNVRGKVVRRRTGEVTLPTWKKAYVRLKDGDAIELF